MLVEDLPEGNAHGVEVFRIIDGDVDSADGHAVDEAPNVQVVDALDIWGGASQH